MATKCVLKAHTSRQQSECQQMYFLMTRKPCQHRITSFLQKIYSYMNHTIHITNASLLKNPNILGIAFVVKTIYEKKTQNELKIFIDKSIYQVKLK